MVIKPWGYGLWEKIQGQLDQWFKETGHKNAYFPMLLAVHSIVGFCWQWLYLY